MYVRLRYTITESEKNHMKTQNLENLTINQVIEILKDLKKGCYHSFTKKHVESNGYYYTKTYVGRLASYCAVSGKAPNEIKQVNGRQTIIPNVLYYYASTNNYLLMVATTKKQSHSKTHYFDNNGNEISKIEYEMVNPTKKSAPFNSVVFNIKLNELIMIR